MSLATVPTLQATVQQVLDRFPQTQETLHRHGLDTCCGGYLPIADAARAAGTDPELVLRDIIQAISDQMPVRDIAGKLPFPLDNRGLAPPEPMTRVLETLSKISHTQYLLVHNDRQPMFLYPHLDEQGFDYFTEPQEDGSFLIAICYGKQTIATK